MRLLMGFLSLVVHVLTSPVTLALSLGLLIGTWLICRHVTRHDLVGERPLLTSEWLGA